MHLYLNIYQNKEKMTRKIDIESCMTFKDIFLLFFTYSTINISIENEIIITQNEIDI